MTPARRSMCWRAPPICAIAKPLGEDIGAIPDGLYPGDYLKPVGTALAEEYGDKLRAQAEPQWLPVVRAKAIDMMMAAVRADLAALNIDFDIFFSERSLIHGAADQVAATIDWLRARGEVYEGRLPPPKGAPAEEWEDREQTLFRSTAFGDDVDRALKKSDGSYTYFASDIAYHRTKIERGFRTLIDVWGADHGGYIKRMQAAVKALSEDRVALDVKLIQLVKLLRAGEPVKMSKRAGDFVTLREVVDEVGRDAVRFMMLFRKNDAVLEFDLAKVIEQSRDNPVFYVQYGHARGQSVFRNARAAFPDLPPDIASLADTADLDRLSDPAERALMRRIALYPRVVEGAALAHEPHRIAFYLYDLASEFHALWTLGNASPHLRFIIQDDRQTSLARLVLSTRRSYRSRFWTGVAGGGGAERDAVIPVAFDGSRRRECGRGERLNGADFMADNSFRGSRRDAYSSDVDTARRERSARRTGPLDRPKRSPTAAAAAMRLNHTMKQRRCRSLIGLPANSITRNLAPGAATRRQRPSTIAMIVRRRDIRRRPASPSRNPNTPTTTVIMTRPRRRLDRRHCPTSRRSMPVRNRTPTGRTDG